MKPFLLVALGLVLCGARAQAQTPEGAPQAPTPTLPVAPAPALSPQAAIKAAQELIRVDEMWSKTLDWKEESASPHDILAHTSKALGTEAPIIEVRVKNSTRSTFALKKAPLGPTLTSLATLLDAEVWVVAGRLVLAPETALTLDEQALVTQNWGGIWKTRKVQWDAVEQLSTVAVPVIGKEVKERSAANGKTAFMTEEEQFFKGISPYELTWNELSPATQQLLRELVELRARRFGQLQEKLSLDASIIVAYDDRYSQWVLRLLKPVIQEDGTPGRQHLDMWAPTKPQPVPKPAPAKTQQLDSRRVEK